MAYSVASFSFLSWQSYLLRVNFSSFQPYYKWKLNTQNWRVQQELQVELSEQAIWTYPRELSLHVAGMLQNNSTSKGKDSFYWK